MGRIKKINWDNIRSAANSSDRINSYTHSLYRYPASLSPILARTIIFEFTKKGQLVFDPFCGGGTTLIESIVNGRKALGLDINNLACFVSNVKANPLSENSFNTFYEWALSVENIFKNISDIPYNPLVLHGNIKLSPKTHGLLLKIRDSAYKISDTNAKSFALLTVLRVGQLCFDCRNKNIFPDILIKTFRKVSIKFLLDMKSYSTECKKLAKISKVRSNFEIMSIDVTKMNGQYKDYKASVSLLLTSPPYPGVHVLYHRWQVKGRKEINLPYNLLRINDNHSESFYTLGPRFEHENKSYFEKIETTFRNFIFYLKPNAFIIQVVAFSNPSKQLLYFRKAMRNAGYREVINPDKPESIISRIVPNRRWYANISPRQHSSKEYLFIHQLDKT